MTEPTAGSQVFAYQLVVHGPGGQAWTFTKQFFTDKEAATEAGKVDVETVIAMLQGGKIVLQTPQGPRAAMTVAELFALLGIVNVSTAGVMGELHGRVLVGAKPGILMPNGKPIS
jgi:hypothetical protein